MANWFHKLSQSPPIIVAGWNSYGELSVYLKSKPYHYVNVSEPVYRKLQFLLQRQNYGAAFKLLKSCKLNPHFHSKTASARIPIDFKDMYTNKPKKIELIENPDSRELAQMLDGSSQGRVSSGYETEREIRGILLGENTFWSTTDEYIHADIWQALKMIEGQDLGKNSPHWLIARRFQSPTSYEYYISTDNPDEPGLRRLGVNSETGVFYRKPKTHASSKSSLLKISQSSKIAIDLSDFIKSAQERIDQFLVTEEERQTYLSTYQFNQQLVQDAINLFPPEKTIQIRQAIANPTEQNLSDAAWEMHNLGREHLKGDYNGQTYEVIRKARNMLQDYSDKLSKTSLPVFDENQAKQYLDELTVETQTHMQAIAETLQQAISRIPNWNGSQIVVKARPIDKQNDLQPETDASIEFGNDEMAPNFTYFVIDETRIEIDDVLEAGDGDFFTDNKIQSDYFNIIKEIRNPGSSNKGGKMLTLYTARPKEDRQRYESSQTIPSGIFLTNKYDSAEGIGRDFGGRDIWRVRIDSRYLITTLDSPNEKQYQAVGPEKIPVQRMELVSPGQ